VLLGLAAVAPATASADPPVRSDLIALDAHLAAHPTDVGAVIQRSELYLRDGQPDEAIADLRYAEALQPGDPRISAQRAAILRSLGRLDEALAELDACIASWASPPMAVYALRARVLAALERREDAIADYDAALALGDEVDLYLERGRLLLSLGRLAEAARGYEEGMLAASGATVLRVAAIEAYLRAGMPERALVLADGGAAISPARARWLLLRGSALEALGRTGDATRARLDALAEIDRRIAARPTVALRVDRGEALLALGRVDEAAHEARLARALSPRLASVLELEAHVARIGGAR
jgi:tetratricopeptide (TPR) repeat protein